MKKYIFLEVESYRDDNKFMNNETGREFSLEEAIDVVIDGWDGMLLGYYSWGLKKVIFTDNSL